MTRRWQRLSFYLFAALVAVGLLVLALRPTPLIVDSAEVFRGPLEVTIEEEGYTRARDRYIVSAPITSQAQRIGWEPGDRVGEGEVLVVLEPIAAPLLDSRAHAQALARLQASEAALAGARAEVEAAAAAADSAADEHRRLAALGEDDLVAERDVERAAAEKRRTEAALRSARFQVAVSEAQLEQARAALTRVGVAKSADGRTPAKHRPDIRSQGAGFSAAQEPMVLRAPVSGVILSREMESAQVVQPSEPLLELASLEQLEIAVEVRSADAVGIQPGMQVRVERWGGEELLMARVRRVEPRGFEHISALGVEERRVLVIADLVSPHEQWLNLGDGYRVNAVFVLWSADDVLQVPSSALFRYEGEWAVFVVEQGRARRREVEIGKRGNRRSQVLSGLEGGDRVVLHPPREIEDGSRVEL